MAEEKRKSFEYADAPAMTGFPVARPGWPYLFAGAFVTLVFALLELAVPAILFLVATGFVCWFFRDPDRLTPQDESLVICPADGRIVFTEPVDENPYVPGRCLKISIFMSVFNVHVNRAPFNATVKDVHYHPGKFFNASLDKASEDNERNALLLTDEKGRESAVVQVAGFVARRILSRVGPGDALVRGQRFGMICFGSRVDCYLPEEAASLVKVGDRVYGGTTVIAEMP